MKITYNPLPETPNTPHARQFMRVLNQQSFLFDPANTSSFHIWHTDPKKAAAALGAAAAIQKTST